MASFKFESRSLNSSDRLSVQFHEHVRFHFSYEKDDE
jgi:hypothetical protein